MKDSRSSTPASAASNPWNVHLGHGGSLCCVPGGDRGLHSIHASSARSIDREYLPRAPSGLPARTSFHPVGAPRGSFSRHLPGSIHGFPDPALPSGHEHLTPDPRPGPAPPRRRRRRAGAHQRHRPRRHAFLVPAAPGLDLRDVDPRAHRRGPPAASGVHPPARRRRQRRPDHQRVLGTARLPRADRPQGYLGGWDICSEPSNAPDVSMVGELIEQVQAFENVDPDRIRIVGFSNGSALANNVLIQNTNPGLDAVCAVVSRSRSPSTTTARSTPRAGSPIRTPPSAGTTSRSSRSTVVATCASRT